MMEDQNVKKETEYEKVQDTETSEIEKLTDECMVEIFQRLPTIADKIRIERVCKRWHYLSQRSWNNFQSLDFSAKTWGMAEKPRDQRLIRDIDLDKIIRLSGRYLTSISIDVGRFASMCHLLPNIRNLQLRDACIDENNKCVELDSGLQSEQECRRVTTQQCTYYAWKLIRDWLMSHGENITNLKIEVYHNHHKEWQYDSLFRKMKQLKSFSLDNWEFLDWSGMFLLELPLEIIQEIVLNSRCGHHFGINLLSTMIQKCEKLQTLGISLDSYEEPVILKLLPLHATSLKNLKLRLDHTWSRQWESVSMSTFSVLTNLEKLDVSFCCPVNDEFLEVVAKNCKKLTYLDLRWCNNVTDRGISWICNLENLAYLNIGYMQEIRNPPLEKLTSLVVLESSLFSMQEECLCTFLKKAHQLRVLSVVSCVSFSKKLLNVAIEVAQTRNSHNALDLYVNRNEIGVDMVDETPPFLNIIDSFYVPLSVYGIIDTFFIELPAVRVKSDTFKECYLD